jgi:hypothetical protein
MEVNKCNQGDRVQCRFHTLLRNRVLGEWPDGKDDFIGEGRGTRPAWGVNKDEFDGHREVTKLLSSSPRKRPCRIVPNLICV